MTSKNCSTWNILKYHETVQDMHTTLENFLLFQVQESHGLRAILSPRSFCCWRPRNQPQQETHQDTLKVFRNITGNFCDCMWDRCSILVFSVAAAAFGYLYTIPSTKAVRNHRKLLPLQLLTSPNPHPSDLSPNGPATVCHRQNAGVLAPVARPVRTPWDSMIFWHIFCGMQDLATTLSIHQGHNTRCSPSPERSQDPSRSLSGSEFTQRVWVQRAQRWPKTSAPPNEGTFDRLYL